MLWSRKKRSPQRQRVMVVHCPEHRADAFFARTEVVGEKTFVICSHEYDEGGLLRTHEIRLPQSK